MLQTFRLQKAYEGATQTTNDKWTALGHGRNIGVDGKKSPINVVIPVVVLFIHDLPEDAELKNERN